MKKRIMYIVSLGIILICLTGCVKFNANMEIKKDKSMNFSIIYAFDKSLFGDEEILSSDDKKEMADKGFSVDNYDDGNYKGFTLTKNVKNIDSVSSTSDVSYSLSGMLEEKEDNYLFKVKKGFFKNTYIANLSFDPADSSLNNSDQNQDDDFNDNDTNWDDNDISSDFDGDNSDMDFSDLSSAMASMDLSFNVKLPYSAKSNNATSVNNDNKELKWTLNSSEVGNIEFEFEMYNIKNIIIVGGVGILIIIAILMSLLNNRKNKQNKVVNPENVAPVTNDIMMNQNNVDALNGITLGVTSINSEASPVGLSNQDGNNNLEIENLTNDISNGNNVSNTSTNTTSDGINMNTTSIEGSTQNTDVVNQNIDANNLNNNLQTPELNQNINNQEINSTINNQINNPNNFNG